MRSSISRIMTLMATATDYYALLGLPRNATEEQIRSAYRKLARQYHPDVNKDAGAADKFKQITEAYEVLSDAERRQRYDMFGSTQGGLGDFGIGDLFETFFGSEFRRREPRGPMRGADLRMEIEIELIDAVRGGERKIRVPRLEMCSHCQGSGAEPGSNVSTCTTCNGRGEVRQVQQSVFGRFVNVSTCPRCGGAGKTVDRVCTKWRGEGRGDQLVYLDVAVARTLTKEQRDLYKRLRDIEGTPDQQTDDARNVFDRLRDAMGGE